MTIFYIWRKTVKYILLITLTISLSACGTVSYSPEEYEITNDRIDDFVVNGNIRIVNAQTDSSKKVFFASTMDWVGDYKTVTEHLKSQLEKEIAENSKKVASDKSKIIEVKVINIKAEQKFFHFTSTMDLEYKLGNGKPGTITVSQGSPGNMWRVLNGTIALGVIEILKQDNVITYLSK